MVQFFLARSVHSICLHAFKIIKQVAKTYKMIFKKQTLHVYAVHNKH